MNERKVLIRRSGNDISIILMSLIVASAHLIPKFIPLDIMRDTLHDEKNWKTVVSTLTKLHSSKPEDLYLSIYVQFVKHWHMAYLFFIGGMNAFFSLIRYNIRDKNFDPPCKLDSRTMLKFLIKCLFSF